MGNAKFHRYMREKVIGDKSFPFVLSIMRVSRWAFTTPQNDPSTSPLTQKPSWRHKSPPRRRQQGTSLAEYRR